MPKGVGANYRHIHHPHRPKARKKPLKKLPPFPQKTHWQGRKVVQLNTPAIDPEQAAQLPSLPSGAPLWKNIFYLALIVLVLARTKKTSASEIRHSVATIHDPVGQSMTLHREAAASQERAMQLMYAALDECRSQNQANEEIIKNEAQWTSFFKNEVSWCRDAQAHSQKESEKCREQLKECEAAKERFVGELKASSLGGQERAEQEKEIKRLKRQIVMLRRQYTLLQNRNKVLESEAGLKKKSKKIKR